jgi:hypothetical protein
MRAQGFFGTVWIQWTYRQELQDGKSPVSLQRVFASEHNGVPLFNQSHLLTRKQVTRTFGNRLAMFEKYRQRLDPAARLLNYYLREFSGPRERRYL